ncbi:MAG: family 78 glycoside hydrolase catalytic domain, partial [Clostridia bacterium]|nr:family 78 glycoside hydrolase catalytic domain [Clostridia bacterium]
MTEFVFPKRVADSSNQQKFPLLLKKQPLQIGLSEKGTTDFSCGDYIILDFGKEMCGGIRILTFLSKDATVRLRFGESFTECSAEIGEKNATNNHALRDFTAQLPAYSDMTFGNTGFRFVRIDFLSGKAQIKSFVAENHILKKQTKYRYGGKDKEIKAIYTA